jgi:predicted RNA-binding Zn-ribbon protein involved in translation (DUF1610 family)
MFCSVCRIAMSLVWATSNMYVCHNCGNHEILKVNQTTTVRTNNGRDHSK